MVCLGNICRSPLAEGILKYKIKNKKIFVDSAGTSSYHIGKLPDSRSIEIALRNGIDIRNQRARQFTETDFDDFEVFFLGLATAVIIHITEATPEITPTVNGG